jgi:hypothetical protein
MTAILKLDAWWLKHRPFGPEETIAVTICGEPAVRSMAAKLLIWSPRVLGVLVSVFIAVFALDAFGSGKPFVEAFADFLIHLIPSLVLLAVVVASWRRPWIGGLAFIAIAIAYGNLAGNHVSWIVAISAPLLIVGILCLWSWYGLRRDRPQIG